MLRHWSETRKQELGRGAAIPDLLLPYCASAPALDVAAPKTAQIRAGQAPPEVGGRALPAAEIIGHQQHRAAEGRGATLGATLLARALRDFGLKLSDHSSQRFGGRTFVAFPQLNKRLLQRTTLFQA
jgi:hypothetical protein